MTNELQNQLVALDPQTATSLETVFAPFFAQAKEWEEKAKAIKVTDVKQVTEMQKARTGRLLLKDIRCEVERRRKELKEESLKKGKAIDTVANIIKDIIEPIEEYLEEQEKFAEIQESKRKGELEAKRRAELAQFEVDCSFYNLREIPEDQYQQLLISSSDLFEAKKKRLEDEEKDRIAKEKADQEERDRIKKENEKLKQDAAEREKALAQERAKTKKAEEELENKRLADEAAKKKAEKEKAKAEKAPDKKKLEQLALDIQNIHIPELKTEEAVDILNSVQSALNKAANFIKLKITTL